MQLLKALLLSVLLAIHVTVQITLTGTNVASSGGGTTLPTATYISYGSTSSLLSTSSIFSTSAPPRSTISGLFSSTAASNKNSGSTITSTSATVTYLTGGQGSSTSSGNSTGLHNSSSTSSSVQPTNTQPCNGHPQFCDRKFSNITMVAAHNSPFVRRGSAASNQQLEVTTQLNDGIRMLQSESHLVNGTIYLCHTSCDILNAGTLESYLTTIVVWLKANPYEVITILMVNSEYVDPGNYTAPVQNSGLINYVYTPPKVPMGINDWPTLSEMIIYNKRVVMMLDYRANQSEIPWLLDEFGQLWETPFSPINASFPCTAQRPPANWGDALPRSNRMYMANHNLNININLAGFSLLIPAYSLLNETNAALEQLGALEATRTNCTAIWNRPPNFLLVDYYNLGNFNGSVFQVAADANNITYNRDSCCGKVRVSAACRLLRLEALAVSAIFCLLATLFVL